MNLSYLFEIQAGLDAHIEEEHPVQENEDRLAKKILALQVELGELANELPEVFKFWSNKKNDYEKALKEYVDGLHFILSIGLELGYQNIIPYRMNESEDGINEFNLLMANVSGMWLSSTTKHGMKFRIKEDYHKVFSIFLSLGKMLGFTWDQIEKAYLEKNKVNHERQHNGY
jgi:dimeric dUTPase (all-alpha-NTP-PPase superfamily)